MDFLKDIALPQPLEHYKLVVLLATLSAVVFVPYLSYTLGAATLSVWLNRRARRTGDRAALRFARLLVQPPFASKSVVAFLGAIPGLSLTFSYAQLLRDTPAVAAGFAATGWLALVAGLALLYTYRYTFRVETLLQAFEGIRPSETSAVQEGEVQAYRESNARTHLRAGTWGVTLLHLAVFLFTAATVAAAGVEHWVAIDSIFAALITPEVWAKYLLVLAFAAGAAGIGMQLLRTAWGRERYGYHPQADLLAQEFGGRWTAAGLLGIPPFLLAALALMPASAAAGGVFALAGVGLLLFLLAAVAAYALFTRAQVPNASAALLLFFAGIAAVVVGDYIALATTTKSHAALMAAVHEKNLDALKLKLGVGAPALTGEDIFNAKCSACHVWDVKKVGPPYFETVPKYSGKRAELVSFVMNPRRVNEAYPPMPSQGLKAAEADSIVSYLLRKVAEAGKMKPEVQASAPK